MNTIEARLTRIEKQAGINGLPIIPKVLFVRIASDTPGQSPDSPVYEIRFDTVDNWQATNIVSPYKA
jgi:hypothetical protein